MRKTTWGLLIILLLMPLALQAEPNREVLYQVSTIDSLISSLYDGYTTFGELKKHGDFGIGTFDALDGEMMLLDGTVYQIASGGTVQVIPDSQKTPFASVTFFDRDKSVPLSEGTDLAKIRQAPDIFESKNLFYAVRIEGEFNYVKTRSVPRQTRPYRKLTEIVDTQPTFEFKNVKGTIIGFCCPYFVKGVNVPGCHFHFLTADRTQGGHILDFSVKNADLYVDVTPEFYLSLPTSTEFTKADFEGTSQKDVEKVEKDNK